MSLATREGWREAGEGGLEASLQLARRVGRFGAWLGGILFILSALLVTVEIVLRKFFNLSTGGSEEIPAYGLAIASAWTYGFALLERGHIRVDTVYALFPPKFRALLDIVSVGIFLLFFALITYYAWAVLADTIRIGTRSRTGLWIPLAVPQSIWFAGLVLTVAIAGLLLLRSVAHLARGEIASVQSLVGSKSADEEIAEEIDAIGKRPEGRSGATP